MNVVRLHEFQVHSLPEYHETQFYTVEGLTVDDMLADQKKPSLSRRLQNSVRQQLHQWRGQRQAHRQSTVAEPRPT